MLTLVGLIMAVVLTTVAYAALVRNLMVGGDVVGNLAQLLVLGAVATGFAYASGRQIDQEAKRRIQAVVDGTSHAAGTTRLFRLQFLVLVCILTPLLVYVLAVICLAVVLTGLELLKSFERLDEYIHPALVLVLLAVMVTTAFTAFVGIGHLVFPSSGREGLGNPIRPDLHDRLWALSREVAERVGTAPAAEIRLLEDTTIAVTEEGGLFAALFGRGHRVLLVGLPTLVELSVADLRSILYHEYAHFAHGDTRWAPIPYRLANTIVHALSAVVQPAGSWSIYALLLLVSPGYWILYGYAMVFLACTGSASRLAEVEADLVELQASGKSRFKEAFRRLVDSSTIVEAGFKRFYAPQLNTGGALVTDISAIMAGGRRALRPNELQYALRERMSPSRVSPFDTHPPLAMRLQYADHYPLDHPLDESPPAATLLDDWTAVSAFMLKPINDRLLEASGRHVSRRQLSDT